MKIKSLNKKLNLKKEKIVNLNKNELNVVKGGTGTGEPNSIIKCIVNNLA